MVAIAVLGSGALSAGASMFGASKAADAQTAAADAATAAQMDMFNKTRRFMKPFVDRGNAAGNMLQGQLGSLTSPIVMDQKTLQETPGYTWNLAQGLKSTQNSATARGLGVSGAAMKGASTFASGLADSTYATRFNQELQSRQNTFNMLQGVQSMGAGAASSLGGNAVATGTNIGNNLIGAGNAQAAATMAGVNGLTGGINSALGGFLYAKKNGLTGSY